MGFDDGVNPFGDLFLGEGMKYPRWVFPGEEVGLLLIHIQMKVPVQGCSQVKSGVLVMWSTVYFFTAVG